MTPEEHRILVETRTLTEENARMLQSIYRTARVGVFFKVLYWVVILGVTFGAYYFIQPYVEVLRGSLSDVQDNSSAVASPFTISGALKNIKDIRGIYGE